MSTAESRKNRSNADILCNPSITKLYCSQAQGLRLDKMVSVLILPNPVSETKILIGLNFNQAQALKF